MRSYASLIMSVALRDDMQGYLRGLQIKLETNFTFK